MLLHNAMDKEQSMSTQDIKDIVVIGGGPGGYVAAVHAAHMGAKVALIEKDKLGGTCLNRGCTPTKALVRIAEIVDDVRLSSNFGIDVESWKIDFPRVMARKQAVVDRLVGGVEQLMKANKISVHRGLGKIVSPHLVTVGDVEIPTRKIIIATGSETTLLPIPGLDLPGVLTTDDILELQELPRSLAVIGGSYTGAEFSSIFAAFGTKVTIVKRRPLRLEPVDDEIGRRFAQTLPKRGINVITGAAVKGIQTSPEGLRVVWNNAEGVEQGVDSQYVLMATGRNPYTKDLFAGELGIKMEGKAITVNERLETNIPDIYAIGDVLGKHMLAHVASYEGEIAVENALGQNRAADYHAIPSCTFVTPEVACVGLSEADAKERGIPYKTSKFPFTANGKAVAMDETAGLIKMICDENGKLLGAHMMGPHASDLIAECTLAIQNGLTAKDIAHTIHAHPTLPEAVMEAAMGQLAGAIHYLKM